MNNRKYARILIYITTAILCSIIAIQVYLAVYAARQPQTLPKVLTWTSLLLAIVTLAIYLASSRINKDVGNMVFTDVTGIKNKLAYNDHVNRLSQAKDTFSVGLMMFDLNSLKYVNDTYGHEMGDRYIEAFSAVLAGIQNDRIGAYRVGGDEFAVILEQTNAVEIHQIMEKLDNDVKAYNERHNLKLSYAAGYEISTHDHYYLMEELTARADKQMYRNKQNIKSHMADRKRSG